MTVLKKNHLRDEKSKSDLFDGFSGKGYDLLFYYAESPDSALKAHMNIMEIKPVEIQEEPIKLFGKTIGKQKTEHNGIFKLSPSYKYEALEKWLCVGNWVAVYPSIQLSEGLDSFRAKDKEIENFMIKNGLEVLIDSFHDNTEWNVFTL